MGKITYQDKVQLNENPNVEDINKCRAVDLNEIKQVVNGNDDNVGNLANLNTTNKSNLVGAINEVNNKFSWTFLGEFIGKNTINLPASFNELSIIVSRTNANNEWSYIFYIPRAELLNGTADKNFLTGHYFTNSNNSGIEINVNTTRVQLKSVYTNGVETPSNTKTKVYYR